MNKFIASFCLSITLLASAASADTVIYDANNFSWETSNYNTEATVSGDVYGLTIEFNGLSANGSSYDSVQYEQETSFTGQFDFSNYVPAISGFNYTIYGQYDIEQPGDINVSVNGESVLGSSSSVFNKAFTLSGSIASSKLLDLSLSVFASSYEDYIQVITGYEDVVVGNELVLQNPGCDDIIDPCIYAEEPIYERQPIYSYQSDLGQAAIYISKIVITPQEIPVPAAVWLFGSALAALGLKKRI